MQTWAESYQFLSNKLVEYEKNSAQKDANLKNMRQQLSQYESGALIAKSELEATKERVKQLETEQDELIRKNDDLSSQIKMMERRYRGEFCGNI